MHFFFQDGIILICRNDDVNGKEDFQLFDFLYKNKLFDLMKSGESGDLSNFLLAHSGLVSVKDRQDNTPLHQAAARDMDSFLRLLISCGGGLDATNSEGRTPLHIALSNWSVTSARLLLRAGAHVRLVDNKGYGALHHGVVGFNRGRPPRDMDIINQLLDRGAHMEPAGDGQTPVHLASAGGWLDLVRLLLSRGGDPSLRTPGAGTPLHQAARFGHLGVLSLLILRGCPVNETDEYGRSALHLAYENGHRKAIDLLENNGASRKIRDQQGRTPDQVEPSRESGTSSILLKGFE